MLGRPIGSANQIIFPQHQSLQYGKFIGVGELPGWSLSSNFPHNSLVPSTRPGFLDALFFIEDPQNSIRGQLPSPAAKDFASLARPLDIAEKRGSLLLVR